MYLTPLQSSSGSTGDDGGDDEVPYYYTRKKKNAIRACLRCRRLKKRCTGQPCFYCIKANAPCEWFTGPDDATPSEVDQDGHGIPTPADGLPKSLPRNIKSTDSLPAEPCVQPGNVYDNLVESDPSVPGRGTPAAVPQTFEIFPGAGCFDVAAHATGTYPTTPSTVHSNRSQTDTTIVEGVPFYPNAPILWSAPADSHTNRHDQPTDDSNPLYRPVDLDAHAWVSRGRVDTSDLTRATVQEAWLRTMSDATLHAVSPAVSLSVCASARASGAPPTYAAQFLDDIDGSLPMNYPTSCRFPDQVPISDLPGGLLPFTDDVSYRPHVSLPMTVPSPSSLSADQRLADALAAGPDSFADDVSYRAPVPLPPAASSTSTLFADQGLADRFPMEPGPFVVDGSYCAYVPLPPTASSSLSAGQVLADGLPAETLAFTDDVSYSAHVPLHQTESPSSTSFTNGLVDGLPVGPSPFVVDGSYCAHVPLPPTASSSLSAGQVLADGLPAETVAFTDDVSYSAYVPLHQTESSSSTSFANGLVDGLPVGPSPFVDDVSYCAHVPLPPTVSPSSTVSAGQVLADGFPAERFTFANDVSYRGQATFPPPVSSPPVLPASGGLVDGHSRREPASIDDVGVHFTHPALPSLTSRMSADNGGAIRDGPMTQTNDVMRGLHGALPTTVVSSSYLSAGHEFALPEGGVSPISDLWYGQRGALSPPGTSSLSLFDEHGLRDATRSGMPGVDGSNLYNANRVFPGLVPPPSSRITAPGLENGQLNTAITFTDLDLLGVEGTHADLVPPSSHLVDYDVRDTIDLTAGVFLFTDDDLLDVVGSESFMASASSSQLTDTGVEEVLPEGSSTFTDADFQAWLLAGTQSFDCIWIEAAGTSEQGQSCHGAAAHPPSDLRGLLE